MGKEGTETCLWPPVRFPKPLDECQRDVSPTRHPLCVLYLVRVRRGVRGRAYVTLHQATFIFTAGISRDLQAQISIRQRSEDHNVLF